MKKTYLQKIAAAVLLPAFLISDIAFAADSGDALAPYSGIELLTRDEKDPILKARQAKIRAEMAEKTARTSYEVMLGRLLPAQRTNPNTAAVPRQIAEARIKEWMPAAGRPRIAVSGAITPEIKFKDDKKALESILAKKGISLPKDIGIGEVLSMLDFADDKGHVAIVALDQGTLINWVDPKANKKAPSQESINKGTILRLKIVYYLAKGLKAKGRRVGFLLDKPALESLSDTGSKEAQAANLIAKGILPADFKDVVKDAPLVAQIEEGRGERGVIDGVFHIARRRDDNSFTVEKAVRLGARLIKSNVFFYCGKELTEDEKDFNEAQWSFIEEIGEGCYRFGIGYVSELLYLVPEEHKKNEKEYKASPEFINAHKDATIAAAKRMLAIPGVTLAKSAHPYYGEAGWKNVGEADRVAALKQISGIAESRWLILSADEPFGTFRLKVEEAAKYGRMAGMLVGRSPLKNVTQKAQVDGKEMDVLKSDEEVARILQGEGVDKLLELLGYIDAAPANVFRGLGFDETFNPTAIKTELIKARGSENGEPAEAKKTILIVEDDERIRVLYREILRVAGNYEVMEFDNGESALAALRSGAVKPDLIVSDLRMPLMGGGGFINSLAQDEQLKGIPVIVASATSEETPADLPNVHMVLQKPVRVPVFIKAIQATIADTGGLRGTQSGEVTYVYHAKDDGVFKDYPWGSPDNIQDMLGLVPSMKGKPLAELWFHSTQKDGPSPIPGGHQMRLLDFVAKKIFSKLMAPEIMKLRFGFNEKIGKNGEKEEEFIGLCVQERNSVNQLKKLLTPYIDTEEKFREYQKAYTAWVKVENEAKWANTALPVLPDFLSEIDSTLFYAIKYIRRELVSYLNEVEPKSGMFVRSPVGILHSSVGSDQCHPLKGDKSKNEAWYVFATNKGAKIYFETLETSNTTWSPFDFPTPIVWKDGRLAMRKDIGAGLDKDIEELLKPGETKPSTDLDAIRLIAERALIYKPTDLDDFITTEFPNVTKNGPYADAKGAKAESMIEGKNDYPQWPKELFTQHRIVFRGSSKKKASIRIMPPERYGFDEFVIIKGTVETNKRGVWEKLSPGDSIFVEDPEKPFEIRSSGQAEVIRYYHTKKGAPQPEDRKTKSGANVAAVNEAGKAELQKTLALIRARGLLEEKGPVVIADGLDRGVAQTAEVELSEYLDGKLISIRAKGRRLLEAVEAKGIDPKNVIFLVNDETIQETGEDGLRSLGKVVHVQNPDDQFIPIIDLYDLALKILYDLGEEAILRSLKNIGGDSAFTENDVRALLSQGIIKILPRTFRIDHASKVEAYHATQRTLHSL